MNIEIDYYTAAALFNGVIAENYKNVLNYDCPDEYPEGHYEKLVEAYKIVILHSTTKEQRKQHGLDF